MKNQRGAHWSYGFTIIEVMIFLAVSGGLLVAAMTTISGQEERTRFSTTVREVESKLGDIFNDVETGYYPNSGVIECKIDISGNPVISAGTKKQGENQDCLFLGKAIQFYKDTSGSVSNYRAFTIVGRRLTPPPGLKDVSSIGEAKPQAFDEIVESGSFSNGVEITQVRFTAALPITTGGIVVLAPLGTFSKDEPSTAASNGKPRLSSINVGTGFTENPTNFKIAVAGLGQSDIDQASQGAVVCLRHSAGGRVAAIAIGVQPSSSGAVPFGQRLATQAYFENEAIQLGCPP